MELYIMRHGQAEDLASTDAERKLTIEGKFGVEDVASAFIKRGWELPKKLVSSPYVRAVETANIMAEKLGILDLKIVSYQEATLWNKMKSYLSNEPILFVGHQPSIGETIEEITGKNIRVKKASLHRIDYDFFLDKGKYVDVIESR